MSGADWHRIADDLAERMMHHAFCDDHALDNPEPSCPFCADRGAYLAYRRAGGTAQRVVIDGPSVSLAEFVRREKAAGSGRVDDVPTPTSLDALQPESCSHTAPWTSPVLTAENQNPETTCSSCGAVMIPGASSPERAIGPETAT